MIGDELPWQDKITGSGHNGFDGYFRAHPEALAEFIHFIQELHGPLDEAMAGALHQWASDLEIDVDRITPHLDKAPVVTPEEASAQALSECERQWMEFGSTAPVAVARMTLQKNEGKMVVPVADGDRGRVYWDATVDFMNMKPAMRNAACQMDSYESDELRDGEAAPGQASNWNGPFAVRADIHPPSQKLAALRQAAWLERQSNPAQGHRPGPRL